MESEKSMSKGVMALIVMGVMVISALGLISVFMPTDRALAGEGVRATPKPPNPATLLSPTDGAKGITDTQVTLSWQGNPQYRGSTRADHTSIVNYQVHVGTTSPQNSNSATADIVNKPVGTQTSLTIQVEPGKTYYWAVRTDDADGSTWSNTASFSTNSKPVVTIDSIDPATPRENVEVTLKGTAVDPDEGDQIVAYQWESSIDGELGTKATVKTVLSAGDHIITFKAQDQYGVWSEEATEMITVEENHAPTKPSGLTPTTTHDLKPTIRWSPSSDEDFDDITYYISIGTTQGGSDIVSEEAVETTSYQLQRSLEYETEKKTGSKYVKEYYISIYAEDEFGLKSGVTTQTLKVENYAPTAPTVTITPQDPYSSSYLVASIVKPSDDKDGDDVEYTYKWYVDSGMGFQERAEFEGQTQILARNTNVGETWKVEVIPSDGIIEGDSASATVTIKDAEPVLAIDKPTSSDVNNDGEVNEEDYEEAGDSDGDGFPDNLYFVGEKIKFDASKTTDPDEGDKLTFEWDFGDDSDTAEGEKVNHVYNQEGTYDVTLTVSDTLGGGKDGVITNEDAGIPIKLQVVYKNPSFTVKFSESTVTQQFEIGKEVQLPLEIVNDGPGPARGVIINITDMKTGMKLLSKPLTSTLAPGQSEKIMVTWKASKGADAGIIVDIRCKSWNGTSYSAYQKTFSFDDLVVEAQSSGYQFVEPKKESQDNSGIWWLIGILLILIIVAVVGFLIYTKKKKEAEAAAAAEEEEEEPQPPTGMLTGPMGAPGMPGMQAYPGMPGMQQYPGLPGAPGMAGPYGAYGQQQYAALPAAGMTQPGMDMYGQQQPGFGQPGYGQQQIPALPQPSQPEMPGMEQPPMGGMPPQDMGGAPMPGMEQPPMGGMPPQDMGGAPMPGMEQPPMGGMPPQDMGGAPMPGMEQPPMGMPPQDMGGAPPADEGGLKCPHCGSPVEEGWLMCPVCKGRLM